MHVADVLALFEKNSDRIWQENPTTWLQIALAAKTAELLASIHDTLDDLSNQLDATELRSGDLQKIIRDVEQIKLNTAPD